MHGQIIKINVQDNQQVKEGDVLFEIDPADYQLQLANTPAALDAPGPASHRRPFPRMKRSTRYGVKSAEAGVEQAQAQQKQVGDSLDRIKPLLASGFATADDVDKAETAVKVAAATLAAAGTKD